MECQVNIPLGGQLSLVLILLSSCPWIPRVVWVHALEVIEAHQLLSNQRHRNHMIRNTITITIIIRIRSWLFYGKIFARLVLRVGSSFLLDPTLNTSPKPHLQKVLPCRHPCHTKDLEPVWRDKSQLLCAQTAKTAQIGRKWLGTQDLRPVWTGPKFRQFQHNSIMCNTHIEIDGGDSSRSTILDYLDAEITSCGGLGLGLGFLSERLRSNQAAIKPQTVEAIATGSYRRQKYVHSYVL